jgi:hypothetical protein
MLACKRVLGASLFLFLVEVTMEKKRLLCFVEPGSFGMAKVSVLNALVKRFDLQAVVIGKDIDVETFAAHRMFSVFRFETLGEALAMLSCQRFTVMLDV